MLGCRKLAASLPTPDGHPIVVRKRVTGIPTIHPFDTGEFAWIVDSNQGHLILYGHEDGVSLHPGPTDTKLDHEKALATISWDEVKTAADWADRCMAEVAAVELLKSAKVKATPRAIVFECLIPPQDSPGFVLSTSDDQVFLVAFGQGGAILLSNPGPGQAQHQLADLALEDLTQAHNDYCTRNPGPAVPE